MENDGSLLDDKNDANTFKKILGILDYIPVVNSSSSAFETIQALLIQGNALGACDYAQAANLWAHALIIGAFIDEETYSSTLNAFIQYEFTPGFKYSIPQVSQGEELVSLQVLYNLFSNGSNESLLQILNSQKNWDWRVVLSTILANPTSNNLTAICSIGDELGKLDLMDAAHFWYFFNFFKNDSYLLCFTHSAVNELDLSRLFLVSSDHINHPSFYRDYRAIQMTELLEYAKSLSGSIIPHFQVYKFAYALELSDLGKSDLSAEYLLAIQSILAEYKGTFGDKFALLSDAVDEVSDRLSVHLSKGASNNKKHAGWFAKGLDSLVSAAVGETLDTLEVRKKSRKYSMSNLSMSESDSLSASLSRSESTQNHYVGNAQPAHDSHMNLNTRSGNVPYLSGNQLDLKPESSNYSNDSQSFGVPFSNQDKNQFISTPYGQQQNHNFSADRKHSPGNQLAHPNKMPPHSSPTNGLSSIVNSGYINPKLPASNYEISSNQIPSSNSSFMNASLSAKNYENPSNQYSSSYSGYMNTPHSPNYEESKIQNSSSKSGHLHQNSTSHSGNMNPFFPAQNYGISSNQNPSSNSGNMNPSLQAPKNQKTTLQNSSNTNLQSIRNSTNEYTAPSIYNPSDFRPQYQNNFTGSDQNTIPSDSLKSDSVYMNGDSGYKSDARQQGPSYSPSMNVNPKSSSPLEVPAANNSLGLKKESDPSHEAVKENPPPTATSNGIL